MNYDQVNQTILINILDFNLLKVEAYLSETEIVLKNDKNYVVMENPKWYFIELPKFRKIKPNINDKLEQWLLFIDDHDKEGIKMAESRNRTLKDAREMMNFLTGGDELKRMREKWELERNLDLQIAEGKGERKGIKKGKKEGIKQTQLQIAKEMLKNNVEMEIIMKCTGLTQENIKKIKDE